jgi:hypothetical protein
MALVRGSCYHAFMAGKTPLSQTVPLDIDEWWPLMVERLPLTHPDSAPGRVRRLAELTLTLLRNGTEHGMQGRSFPVDSYVHDIDTASWGMTLGNGESVTVIMTGDEPEIEARRAVLAAYHELSGADRRVILRWLTGDPDPGRVILDNRERLRTLERMVGSEAWQAWLMRHHVREKLEDALGGGARAGHKPARL